MDLLKFAAIAAVAQLRAPEPLPFSGILVDDIGGKKIRQAYNTSHYERWLRVFDTQETPKNSKITIIVVIVAVMLVLIAATWFLTS